MAKKRPVAQVDKNNNIIKTYESAAKAAADPAVGSHAPAIINCCLHGKGSPGGFVFKYLDIDGKIIEPENVEEKTISCEICSAKFDNLAALARHVDVHGYTSEQYTVEFFYGGIRPTCTKCNNFTVCKAMKFVEFCGDHAGTARSAGLKASKERRHEQVLEMLMEYTQEIIASNSPLDKEIVEKFSRKILAITLPIPGATTSDISR